MIISNGQPPTPQAEPQKLNVITTAQVGNEKPAEVKGPGTGKMITTHDLPDKPVAAVAVAPSEEPKKPGKGKKAE